MFLKISHISQENTCVGVSLNSSCRPRASNLVINDYKETETQFFSCKICEIFKITYFEEHQRTTASTAASVLTCPKESFRIFQKLNWCWKWLWKYSNHGLYKSKYIISFPGHLLLIFANEPSQTDILSTVHKILKKLDLEKIIKVSL